MKWKIERRFGLSYKKIEKMFSFLSLKLISKQAAKMAQCVKSLPWRHNNLSLIPRRRKPTMFSSDLLMHPLECVRPHPHITCIHNDNDIYFKSSSDHSSVNHHSFVLCPFRQDIMSSTWSFQLMQSCDRHRFVGWSKSLYFYIPQCPLWHWPS